MSTEERITLWNCHNFTYLEIIKQVKDDLLRQGVKSIDVHDSCQYTGEFKGCKIHCGIGWLIPQKKYNTIFEGFTVDDLLVQLGLFISEEYENLLLEIQRLHDDYDPEEWEFEFMELERRWASKT
jgi:hypothetical protein